MHELGTASVINGFPPRTSASFSAFSSSTSPVRTAISWAAEVLCTSRREDAMGANFLPWVPWGRGLAFLPCECGWRCLVPGCTWPWAILGSVLELTTRAGGGRWWKGSKSQLAVISLVKQPPFLPSFPRVNTFLFLSLPCLLDAGLLARNYLLPHWRPGVLYRPISDVDVTLQFSSIRFPRW